MEAPAPVSAHFSPNPKNPTIVIIPSFFHTPDHFTPLAEYLQSQGHESYRVRLPSIGDEAGRGNGKSSDDVEYIRELLEALVGDEKDVVLVMHSYGAVPGCQAVAGLEHSHRVKQGKRGGIISLVFIGGLLASVGLRVSGSY